MKFYLVHYGDQKGVFIFGHHPLKSPEDTPTWLKKEKKWKIEKIETSLTREQFYGKILSSIDNVRTMEFPSKRLNRKEKQKMEEFKSMYDSIPEISLSQKIIRHFKYRTKPKIYCQHCLQKGHHFKQCFSYE